MGNIFFFDWEIKLMEFLQGFGGSIGVAIASFITRFGDEMALVAILGFIYWCYDKEYGKYMFTNFIPSLVYAPMLKNIVCRRRPYMDNPTIKCLKPVDSSADIYDISAQGYSFPSMHSANSTTIYGSVSAYNIRKGTFRRWMLLISVLLPLLIGVSRAYVGVHYPTDILFGWFFGLAIMLIMDRVQSKVQNPRLIYIVLILLGFPGVFFCNSNDFFTCYGIMIGSFSGFLFEEKTVNFDMTSSPIFKVSRLIFGLALFEGLNFIFKLPFPDSFLDSATKAALFVRLFRYVLVSFIVIGIYPSCFCLEKKLLPDKR